MDNENKTFQRMNLHQICGFILNGVENLDIVNQSYSERLAIGSQAIYNRLENLYPDEIEFEKASADLAKALTSYENVFTEIGMKAGLRIILQLLNKDNGAQSDIC